MIPGRIVVTGAGGFIGGALVARLARRGRPVLAVMRRPVEMPAPIMTAVSGNLTPDTPWEPLLRDAGAVIHLAARAHAPAGDEAWSEQEAAIGASLARAAMRAGVARLILLSSIKVLGERTRHRPFRAEQTPAPEDAYGRSKWRLEQAMREAAGPALTILRPPLVYGPGVKGNFRALLRWIDRGLPLPLAAIANRRSLVFLDNLLDLIERALDHPAAAAATWLLRDDPEISTPDLIRAIATALGRPARLLPCPPTLLKVALSAAGRKGAADRLLESLSIDDSTTRSALGWQPRVGLAQGLAATAEWYRRTVSA